MEISDKGFPQTLPPSTRLSFAQAQGVDELPSQARIRTISPATSAALWRILHDTIKNQASSASRFATTNVSRMLRNWWVDEAHQMIDDAPISSQKWIETMRKVFDAGFPHSYNVAQFMLDSRETRPQHAQIADALETTLAAYRVVGGKIVPFASEYEHQQLVSAIENAEDKGALGARSHLIQAANEMTSGNWRKSVHESVSAIESVAKLKTGEHDRSLSGLVKELQKNGSLPHPALAAAISKLYGYSSDEQGIRHSLVLDGDAKITERDAFLMLGLCSAFVTYILQA